MDEEKDHESNCHAVFWTCHRSSCETVGHFHNEFWRNIFPDGGLDPDGDFDFHLQRDSEASDGKCFGILPWNAVDILFYSRLEPRGIFGEVYYRMDGVRDVLARYGLFCVADKRTGNIPQNRELGNHCCFNFVIHSVI